VRDAVIETRALRKRFGANLAVADLSLSIGRGEVFGFLGPNGAGKTTAIRSLLGFIRPTSGNCQIFGHDCWRDGVRARNDLGFLVSAGTLYPDMTGSAYLDYAARLGKQSPSLRETLVSKLELDEAALGRKIGGYSKGMKQKLALIACMQTSPKLLILDEPTDGLDPLMQRAFEEILRLLHARGTTIFMSSHDLGEVERVCQRVAIIRAGKIVAEAAIDDLTARRQRLIEVAFSGQAPDWAETASARELERDGNRLVISSRGQTRQILMELSARDDVSDILVTRPSLEQIFHEYYASPDDLERANR
jgi:ABC-2 type transport system ATP-binding protein